jgi:Protein of unknown function (DUF2637)
MSDRTLRILTWLLVGAIALIAFAVSFEAISAYAVAVGAFPRPLRWCAPLLVDAFTVAACLVILARSRDGERAVYAWSLVVVASTVSVALNVAHAPPHTPARLVASLPPAVLLAALELAMSEARRLRARADRAEADALPAPQPEQSAPESIDHAMAAELQAATVAHEAVGSRVIVRTLLAEDRDASVEAVMDRTGLKRRRAYELLRQERAAMNGASPQ